MISPSLQEFRKLAKKGNLVPVYSELPADTETPVTAYSKLAGKNSFLLESITGGESVARYSFIGTDPILCFKGFADHIEIIKKNKTQSIPTSDPFNALRDLLKQYQAVSLEQLPPFHGGAVGYVSYDAIRLIENIPARHRSQLNLPLLNFMIADTLVAFDIARNKIIIIVNALIEGSPTTAYQQAEHKIHAIKNKLRKSVRLPEISVEVKQKAKLSFDKARFSRMLKKAQHYITEGDIFQVVLSHRFTATIQKDPLSIYRKLRMINPSPYMFFLNFGDHQLIGSSPEILVRLENGTASVRPIAGTRPRGKDKATELLLVHELLADAKELAEHTMLVDLGRNDLGRVCKYGTVKPTEIMAVEKYSHVMHIVSNISGELAPENDAFDLLRATFPAGTVSGAPKIRAMEIIDELEDNAREHYAGCVGYFDFNGNLDSCITIRTILTKGKKAYVQVGAGIVADSQPSREYQEIINKGSAMMLALN